MGTGQMIRNARKKAGMTQAELAAKIGVATITIRQYESEKREPRNAQLLSIADALNVTMFELVCTHGKLHEILRAYDEQLTDPTNTSSEAVLTMTQAAQDLLVGLEESVSDVTATILQIAASLDKLNDDGKIEAIKRVEELSEIPRYRKADTSDDP